jgi:glycosyltransferase involved in cell wall biosynthesis
MEHIYFPNNWKDKYPEFYQQINSYQRKGKNKHDDGVDVLAGIYRSCDCFVFPSKAEGWGLPLIEALACGIPVITTFYSGHTEFLECCKDYIADVNFHLEEIKAEDFLRWGYKFNGDPGKWAIPNIDTISNKMKTVYENKDEWKLKGLNASEKTVTALSSAEATIVPINILIIAVSITKSRGQYNFHSLLRLSQLMRKVYRKVNLV